MNVKILNNFRTDVFKQPYKSNVLLVFLKYTVEQEKNDIYLIKERLYLPPLSGNLIFFTCSSDPIILFIYILDSKYFLFCLLSFLYLCVNPFEIGQRHFELSNTL